MNVTCSKQFTITVGEGGGPFYNEAIHTAYGWCNADILTLYSGVVLVGEISSEVSQEDAETQACAEAHTRLETLLTTNCGAGNFTAYPGCDVVPTLYENTCLLGDVYYCDGDCGDMNDFLTGTGVAAGLYFSRESQEDADAQAVVFQAELVAFATGPEGVAACLPGGPPQNCGPTSC